MMMTVEERTRELQFFIWATARGWSAARLLSHDVIYWHEAHRQWLRATGR